MGIAASLVEACAGAKVTDLAATVTVSRIIDGHYGAKTLLVLRTDGNQLIKWFATGVRDNEPGQRVRILRATVKDHETFRDQDQTVVTRAKLERLDPAALTRGTNQQTARPARRDALDGRRSRAPASFTDKRT